MRDKQGVSDIAEKIICPRCGNGQPGHKLGWMNVGGKSLRTLLCPDNGGKK